MSSVYDLILEPLTPPLICLLNIVYESFALSIFLDFFLVGGGEIGLPLFLFLVSSVLAFAICIFLS